MRTKARGPVQAAEPPKSEKKPITLLECIGALSLEAERTRNWAVTVAKANDEEPDAGRMRRAEVFDKAAEVLDLVSLRWAKVRSILYPNARK